ncbi:hypothetical protein FG382_19590 [Psychrobacillus lasiicapitis]|uniref:Uncharacterized protein n=1 Tax=Psychrobacillus lasiicapitis TaxID=1636719 RepID=A0A544SWN6_9BACI|nr:hypothetical protein FG382_19590 [Psychrobacillus lasiicapitis]
MRYDYISQFFISLSIWWGFLLIFQRLNNRYPQNNTWKKDILLTLIQSIVILLILFPILCYFVKSS